MIFFRVDILPVNRNIILSYDYSASIVFSAVSDPLFKYSYSDEKIIPHACLDYFIGDCGKSHTFVLRNDLYFYNGIKVSPLDYFNTINKIRSSQTPLKYLFTNIKDMFCTGNNLIIELYKPNYSFYKLFSKYNITPYNNNLTSGPYFIEETNNQFYLLKRNKYFRNNILSYKYENIKFIKSTDFCKDIQLFKSGNLDITCNTMFPFWEVSNYFYELKIFPSNIFASLDFINSNYLNNRFVNLRKAILISINRSEICQKFCDMFFVANDYFLDNYHPQKDIIYNRKLSIDHINKYFSLDNANTIRIGYDEFYPNKEILICVKDYLEYLGLKVTLVTDDFFNPRYDYDMKLSLNYPDFVDNMAFYTSPYFLSALYVDKVKFNAYYKLYKSVLNFKDGSQKDKYLNIMNKIVLDRVIKIPLFKMNSIYFVSNKLNNFNFLSLDYSILK